MGQSRMVLGVGDGVPALADAVIQRPETRRPQNMGGVEANPIPFGHLGPHVSQRARRLGWRASHLAVVQPLKAAFRI